MTAAAFRDRSENVVAAAVEHLGAKVTIDPTDEGRWAFLGIHDVAIRLRDAVHAARPH